MRNATWTLSFIFFSSFIFSTAFAQKTITGLLMDSISSEPLINATIVIEEDISFQSGALSDFEGSFQLTNVDVEKGILLVSYLGYNPTRIPFDFKGQSRIDLGQLTIAPTSIGMDEIKVVSNIAIDRKTPVAVSSTA